MNDLLFPPCTAFDGQQRLASGPLDQVTLAVKAATEGGAAGPVLIFGDDSGRVIDVDTRGSAQEVVARLALAAVETARREAARVGSPPLSAATAQPDSELCADADGPGSASSPAR